MTGHPFPMWKLTLLSGFWTFAVSYAFWFSVQVWTEPGLMLYAGHQFSLLLWGIPLLPRIEMAESCGTVPPPRVIEGDRDACPPPPLP